MRIPVETLNTISVIVITIILSYFTLVLGELVPKRIAMRHSEKLGLAMSGFVSAIARIFKPVVWFLTKSTNFLLRLLGIDPEAEDDTVTEEEIRMLVDAGSEKGAIDIEEGVQTYLNLIRQYRNYDIVPKSRFYGSRN